ncbi:MAG: hypothetical protein KDA44_15350 [Planctomycetales bacterium]|nr:hypothetical protein [Planctomycetales bacterium]
MVPILAAGLTLCVAALALAYVREVRLRRALERLLSRILLQRRRHAEQGPSTPDDSDSIFPDDPRSGPRRL